MAALVPQCVVRFGQPTCGSRPLVSKVDELIVDLAAERERRKGRTQREAIDRLNGYLKRNRYMMDYPRYRDAGYPIASAAIESANKRLVGRRCKQGGMIWSEPGLEAMVALRVPFYNHDTWRRLWPTRCPRRAAAMTLRHQGRSNLESRCGRSS